MDSSFFKEANRALPLLVVLFCRPWLVSSLIYFSANSNIRHSIADSTTFFCFPGNSNPVGCVCVRVGGKIPSPSCPPSFLLFFCSVHVREHQISHQLGGHSNTRTCRKEAKTEKKGESLAKTRTVHIVNPNRGSVPIHTCF